MRVKQDKHPRLTQLCADIDSLLADYEAQSTPAHRRNTFHLIKGD